jgi:hypothetical protein
VKGNEPKPDSEFHEPEETTPIAESTTGKDMKDAEDREREIEIKSEEDPDTEELIEEKIPEEANQKDEGSISGLPNIGDKEFSP